MERHAPRSLFRGYAGLKKYHSRQFKRSWIPQTRQAILCRHHHHAPFSIPAFAGYHTTRAASTTPMRGPKASAGEPASPLEPIFPKKTRLWKIVLAITLGGVLVISYVSLKQESGDQPLAQYLLTGRELNPKTFVPFTIVSREQITENSFILTIRPQSLSSSSSPLPATISRLLAFFLPSLREHSHGAVYAAAWAYGLWAVEFKQPQLQIAREYTPLPPLYGREEDDERTGDLRFFVRAVGGGEVSTYLSRLPLGATVELRGPHLGFDVRRRLGLQLAATPRRVVFLAGGTGIAPALQVVRAVLDDASSSARDDYSGVDGQQKPAVSIVWANRLRADSAGCDAADSDLPPASSPVVKQLLAMMQRHGEHLDLRCVVDEDKTFIDERLIRSSISSSPRTSSGVDSTGRLAGSQSSCPYHSDVLLQRTATDPAAKEAPRCSCASGRDLVFVSGPGGFINALAGPKLWEDGHELQGAVGGLLGRTRRIYREQLRDWLVLKL